MQGYYKIGIALLLFASCKSNTKSTGTTDSFLPDSVSANALSTDSTDVSGPKSLAFKVIGTLPHDTASYTEGFEIHGAKIYEGTGTFKNSHISVADTSFGKVENVYPVKDKEIYGEGITILNDQLFQLTYQNHKAFVYKLNDLTKPIGTFKWPYEGWGMTNDGKNLYVSVGSSIIYVLDPNSFAVVKKIQVKDVFGTVDQLNELEYIDGYLYINKWLTTKILKVDPATGAVVGILDCFGLLSQFAPDYTPMSENSVLNGIAWDSEHKVMMITGKNWPLIFRLKLQ
jgi:glutamine cyclotransferase